MSKEAYSPTFVCPACGNEADIEVITYGAIVIQRIGFINDDSWSVNPAHDEIQELDEVRFQCSSCGNKIPAVDDESLVYWFWYEREEPNDRKRFT